MRGDSERGGNPASTRSWRLTDSAVSLPRQRAVSRWSAATPCRRRRWRRGVQPPRRLPTPPHHIQRGHRLGTPQHHGRLTCYALGYLECCHRITRRRLHPHDRGLDRWPTTPPSGVTYSAEWGTATPLESAARMDILKDEQQTPRRGKALGFLPRWRAMTWLIAVSNLLVVLKVVRTPRATSAAASQ